MITVRTLEEEEVMDPDMDDHNENDLSNSSKEASGIIGSDGTSGDAEEDVDTTTTTTMMMMGRSTASLATSASSIVDEADDTNDGVGEDWSSTDTDDSSIEDSPADHHLELAASVSGSEASCLEQSEGSNETPSLQTEDFSQPFFDQFFPADLLKKLPLPLRELALLLEKSVHGYNGDDDDDDDDEEDVGLDSQWEYVRKHRSEELKRLMKSKSQLSTYNQTGKKRQLSSPRGCLTGAQIFLLVR